MTIPASLNCFFWVICLTATLTASGAKRLQTVFPEDFDRWYKSCPDSVYEYLPVYENHFQTKAICPIAYVKHRCAKVDFIKRCVVGTFLCSPTGFAPDTLRSFAILRDDSTAVQLVRRESNDYVGYLTELLTVPFVMPPRLLGCGHQTDLRLGTDCAELAIYGKRRQGYPVPYCGPVRILNYLTPCSVIRRGTVISFGFQISVVYQDNGIIGTLDDADLLIQAYKDKAEIVAFGKTDLIRYPYKSYEWKF